MVQMLCGCWSWLEDREYDYSYYLGPDYKKTQDLPVKAGLIVCNHQSWLDAPVLLTTLLPGFVTSKEASKVPVLREMVNGL